MGKLQGTFGNSLTPQPALCSSALVMTVITKVKGIGLGEVSGLVQHTGELET